MKRTLIVLLLAVVAASCSDSPRADSESSSVGTADEDLAWATASPAERVAVVRRPGRVVSPLGASWQASPGVAARILEWQVSVGDMVAVGEPVATLISPELSDLDAAVRRLVRVVKERERLVDTRRASVERGFQSIDSLNDARLQLTEAQAELTRVRQQISVRDRNVKSGKNAEWTWVASAEGRITAIDCSPGMSVSADQNCMTVASMDSRNVEVDVPARASAVPSGDLRASIDGQPVSMVRRAGVLNDRQAETIWFDAPSDVRLGAAVLVDIEAAAPAGAVVVPRSAIVQINGEPNVFVDTDEGPLPRVVVEMGRIGEERVVTGIDADSRVVSRGAFLLKSKLAFP